MIAKYEYVAGQREKGLFQLAEDDRDFTGRSQETETIEKILKSDAPMAMISAVSGMGGVGKSVLARHVGNRLKATFPDGQLYVDLLGQSETRRSPDSVLIDFLVDGFGEDPKHLPFELEGLRKLFHDRLKGQKILVVLDNAADAGQVEPLLPRVKGCGALVTSREALTNLAGMTAENFVPLDVMTEPEAIELVQRLCPSKTTDEVLVTRLVGLCGRLPLALTIVGKLLLQTVSLTLVELMAELSQERSRLWVLKYRDARDVVDARLDVEASFNLSYGRLSEAQRSLFEAVAVLRGRDFGRELAAVLVEREEALVRKQLDQLVALQLVQWETGRYGFHDLVREFGQEKLGEEQEQELTERALGWYVTMADQMNDFVRSDIRIERARVMAQDSEQSIEEIDRALLAIGLSWFEVEWLNILEGITWAKLTERAEFAVKLFACGQVFSGLQGKRTEIFVKAGEEALVAAQKAGDRLGEANTLKAIGDALQFLDQRREALNRYEAAIDIYQQVGDRVGEANTLQAIGDALQFLDQRQDALNRYEAAIDIYQQVGDRVGEANTLQAIGDVFQFLKQSQKALKFYEIAIDIYRQMDARLGEANTLQAIGDVFQFLKQSQKALKCYETAIDIYRRVGARLGEANTLKVIGDVLQFLDQRHEALKCYENAIVIYQKVDARLGEANTLKAIGDVLQFLDQRHEALKCYENAIVIYHKVGDRLGEANTLKEIGDILQFLGQRQEALNHYETAIDIYQQVGARLGEANTLKAIGDALQFLGQRQEALNHYETAIDIYQQVGARLGEANTLKAIGDLEEDPKNGLKRFNQAMQIYQDIGDQYSQSRILVTSLAPAYIKLNQPYQAKESYEKALPYFEEINLEVGIELCKEQLKNLNQQPITPRDAITPEISNDRPPKKKKPFPLYPTIAALLLILGISYWQTLARQQTKPIGLENIK